ncbi:MAG: hypothetical protein IBX55_00680 [Methyloprofundus sp.]|nr:hypothetical protein [Methyloprofundus sp.]
MIRENIVTLMNEGILIARKDPEESADGTALDLYDFVPEGVNDVLYGELVSVDEDDMEHSLGYFQEYTLDGEKTYYAIIHNSEFFQTVNDDPDAEMNLYECLIADFAKHELEEAYEVLERGLIRLENRHVSDYRKSLSEEIKGNPSLKAGAK